MTVGIKNYSQFPAAGPITGTEIVPIMQGGVTKQTTATAIAGVSAFIPGTFTSAQILATYPPANNAGRSALTTDLGLLTCDGIRWLVVGTPPIPAGAAVLGYKQNVYTVLPVVADIAFSGNVDSRLYSGFGPFANIPPASAYTTAANGQLQLIYPAGGPGTAAGLVTTQNAVNSQQLAGNLGILPYLLAGQGFYFEYAATQSSNNTDIFNACFLEPQEHNTIQLDHKPGDPPGYERWIEFDINESGHGTDHSGAFRGSYINWIGPFAGPLNFTVPPTGTGGTLTASSQTDASGHWLGDTFNNWTIKFSDGQTHSATLTNGSNVVTWTGAITGTPTTAATVTFAKTVNTNNIQVTALDYSVEHIFGMSFDPVANNVVWYLDGVAQGSASTAASDPFIDTYHYYPIFYMQSHGALVGSTMNLRYFSAWTP